MKKILVLGLSLFVLCSLQAQNKITKAGLIGKWQLSSMEMSGMFYYSIDKDSLSLGDMIKAQVKDDAAQISAMTTMMKSQMAMLSKMSFEFNADGTALINPGMGDSKAANYTVDEVNSTITTIEKSGDKKETIKADALPDNQIRFAMKAPEGDIVMVLKKAK
jgi:hypothetical protein